MFYPSSSQPDAVERERPLYVFGHKNPDSDSICSSLVVADWLNNLGKPAVTFRLGELTPETRYILAAAGVQAPRCCKTISAIVKSGWSILPTPSKARPHCRTATWSALSIITGWAR